LAILKALEQPIISAAEIWIANLGANVNCSSCYLSWAGKLEQVIATIVHPRKE
jgi:hypothetical protein